MKTKLEVLLHDVTIINFSYVVKLMKRYYFLTILIPIIGGILSYYFYKNQNEIYSGQISFRYIPEVKDSPLAVLSTMSNEVQNGNNLTPTEIVGIGKSVSFLQELAKRVVGNTSYDKLNMNSIFAKKKVSTADMLADCPVDDKECKFIFFRKRLPEFYTIEEDNNEINKYNIVVKTLSRTTTDQLIESLAKSIHDYRVGMIKFQVGEQVNVAEKLLEKESDRLDKLNITKVLEGRDIFQTNLDAILKKITTYNVVLGEKKVEYDQAKISLKYTKSTLKSKTVGTVKKDLKSLEKLVAKKELLIADITAIEYSLGEESASENLVIKELRKELKTINKRIITLEKNKEGAFKNIFHDEKLKSKEAVQFNLKVLKDQISSLESTLSKLAQEKNIVIAQLKEKEDFLEENRTIIDYKKLLEGKLLQLKLKEDTIVSDFSFDKYLSSSKRYKKYSLALFIPFAILVTGFVIFIFIVIRYYFDPRIVDREEFEIFFDEIPIVGDVPHYD